ncbi:unnamed protein product [Linum trigynum]|uniref:Uncharacterized protein n=1 Tax=Linum trigynum TaxID=586398 RepID=A0AAV2FVH5_9ROSI
MLSPLIAKPRQRSHYWSLKKKKATALLAKGGVEAEQHGATTEQSLAWSPVEKRRIAGSWSPVEKKRIAVAWSPAAGNEKPDCAPLSRG